MSRRKVLVYFALSALLLMVFSMGLWTGENRVLRDAETLESLSSMFRIESFAPFDFGIPELPMAGVLDVESKVLRAYAHRDREGLRNALELWQDPEIRDFALKSLREWGARTGRQDEMGMRIIQEIRSRYIDPEAGEWIPEIRRMAEQDFTEIH